MKGLHPKTLPYTLMNFKGSMEGYDKELDKTYICYWRKCWNIREAMLDIPSKPQLHGYYEFDREGVKAAAARLQDIHDHPEEWDNSIWEYDEQAFNIERCIWRLKLLSFFLLFHPHWSVFFYNSY